MDDEMNSLKKNETFTVTVSTEEKHQLEENGFTL